MKKILLYFFIVFFSVFYLQAQTTEGTEFWLTFGGWNIPNPLSNPYDMQIRIVCGSQPTTVTIHFTNLDTYFSTNISAYEVYTYTLDNTQRVAMYNMGTGKSNYSAHITTTKPVSVYALQSLTVSRTDVTNLLPVTALNSRSLRSL